MEGLGKPVNNYAQQFRLDSKVAIVTGASKGIGASIAKGLAEFGASVVVSSRNQEAIDEVAKELNQEGYSCIAKACNVGSNDQVQALCEATVQAFGGVDIIVNNAATNPVYGPIEDIDDRAFNKIFDVNVKGPFLLSKLALPSMKSRGSGSIINIASVEGLKPSKGIGMYGVSKAALISLSQVQAKEWGKYNIRVNVICPGLVKTKFSQALWTNEKIMDQVTTHLPIGRMAEADEMSGLAIYLASDASSYVTGGVFVADGGHMIA
ncbi:MAG: glucose 1-dehydrogenase [Bacteroidia bacterium]|nr:glucose 1-dehydrogenase [Bacteroidia bacterium]